MPDPTPAVSPTGLALIPAKFVPYLLSLVGVAGTLAGLPEMLATAGIPVPAFLTVPAMVAKIITVVGLALVGATPGLRKKQADDAGAAAVAAVQGDAPSKGLAEAPKP